jgi:excisionase family DNA binding protein
MSDRGVEPLDRLLDELADRIAARLARQLDGPMPGPDRWLTTREASAHLGVHQDTLRRLASARVIPYEQDGPGCALHFRLSELDRWREEGGSRRTKPRSGASTRLPYPLRAP